MSYTPKSLTFGTFRPLGNESVYATMPLTCGLTFSLSGFACVKGDKDKAISLTEHMFIQTLSIQSC